MTKECVESASWCFLVPATLNVSSSGTFPHQHSSSLGTAVLHYLLVLKQNMFQFPVS